VDSLEGFYDISFRAATIFGPPGDSEAPRTITLTLDGDELGTVAIPNTGAWDRFEEVTLPSVFIPTETKGKLRVTFNVGDLIFSGLGFVQSVLDVVSWRVENGLAPDGSEDHFSLSVDGIPALLKLAFGMGDPAASSSRRTLDPNNPELGGLPSAMFDGGDSFSLSYLRHKGANSGLDYSLEVSDALSLNSWSASSSVSGLIQNQVITPIVGSNYEMVQLTVDRQLFRERLFCRLKIVGEVGSQ